MKRREKSGSILAGVPAGLPALLQAHRLSERAGRVGFDWPDPAGVLESVDRELDELREAAEQGSAERTAEELGDLLFTLANLGRRLEVGSEDALRRANRKFRRRFEYIEQRIAEQGRTLDEADLEEMDRYWDEAKKKGL
jgi:uncharacterized protein YabN with tetrapyrrole methylase and pyrophosphatase domain